MLRRLILIAALCLPARSSGDLAVAQTAPPEHRSFRIALLSDTTYFSEHATAAQWDAGEQLAGLRQGMKDVGVVENKDWILIPRIANRDHELLDKYAAELAAMKVDVIAVSSTTAAMAAEKSTKTIPIVGWGSLGGAVSAGEATNVTGFAQPPVTEYIGHLRMFVPDLKRLAVLYDLSYAVASPMLEELKQAAPKERIELLPIEVGDNDDLAPAFDRMVQQHAQAVLVVNHPRFGREAGKLAALALEHRLPMATPYRQVADAGGLIAHHPDWEKIWQRGAKVIKQILDGTPPSRIPVETGDMRYYINVKTANALGLTIPEPLRKRFELIGEIETRSQKAEAATRNEIEALENQCLRATLHADTAFPENYFADDYTQIGYGGNLTGKQDQIRFRKTGQISYQALDLKDRTIKVYGDVAVVVMHSYAKYTSNGHPVEGDFRATRVWNRQNGMWKIVSFQTNKVDSNPSGISQTAGTSGSPSAAEIDPTLKEAIARRTKAEHNRDVETFSRMTTDDFTLTNQRGEVITRAARIEQLRTDPISPEPPPTTEDTTKMYGEETALRTRRVLREGKPIRMLTVWVKQNGQWKVAATQITAEQSAAP